MKLDLPTVLENGVALRIAELLTLCESWDEVKIAYLKITMRRHTIEKGQIVDQTLDIYESGNFHHKINSKPCCIGNWAKAIEILMDYDLEDMIVDFGNFLEDYGFVRTNEEFGFYYERKNSDVIFYAFKNSDNFLSWDISIYERMRTCTFYPPNSIRKATSFLESLGIQRGGLTND